MNSKRFQLKLELSVEESAFWDTLYMRNGEVLKARILANHKKSYQVRLADTGEEKQIPSAEIIRVNDDFLVHRLKRLSKGVNITFSFLKDYPPIKTIKNQEKEPPSYGEI